MQDEIILSLLPRAFSKLTRIYAYIDTKHHWLVLDSANAKKTEQFLSIFRRTIDDQIHFLELKKLSPIMTRWLKHKNCPSSFAVEKTCMLQDPDQQTRIVRCYQQDLFVNSIQSLINDGYEVKEIALSWQDQVHFILADDFSLRCIQFQDEIREQAENMEPETQQQKFNADFLIMTTTLSSLLEELLSLFIKSPTTNETEMVVN